MYPLYTALIACFLNLIVTPVIIAFAIHFKLFDRVDERKIHSGNIPRLGGIGIFTTSFAVIIGTTIVSAARNGRPVDLVFVPVAAGMLAVHAISLVDDFKSVSAVIRMAVQIAAGAALAIFDFRFHSLWLPFLGVVAIPVWLSWAITLLWIVGVINAMNMIDGMDALCGGIGIIAACTYGILYTVRGETIPALYAFALVGSLAGFLFYNYPPAKIFMGDSGSTFVGFMLAILPLLDRSPANQDIALYMGATIALLPIFDTFAAIWRRTRERRSPMSPDKWHLHHKLLGLGVGARMILAMVYTTCMGLGAVAISSCYFDRTVFFVVMTASWLVLMCLFFVLHYLKEFKLKGLSD